MNLCAVVMLSCSYIIVVTKVEGNETIYELQVREKQATGQCPRKYTASSTHRALRLIKTTRFLILPV